MATWKVLVIGLLAFICLGLGTASGLMLMGAGGADKWAWFGGLAGATLFFAVLFVLFLRHADRTMDQKPSWDRR